MLIRLNKYLADRGISSRRDIDKLIEKGSISVNGTRATLGMKVDPENDQIILNGKILHKQNAELVYYALYKPAGVVSTSDDPQGRKKVTDYVPEAPRVYPVGRLDYDSEGLIIITNDGELTNMLTHPSFEHEKEYRVEVGIKNNKLWKDKDPQIEIPRLLTSGLNIEDQFMSADSARLSYIKDSRSSLSLKALPSESKIIFQILITLHTGYNRQIRKMCAKIGLEVQRLTRIKVAKLSLDSLGLKPGQFKIVNKEDIL